MSSHNPHPNPLWETNDLQLIKSRNKSRKNDRKVSRKHTRDMMNETIVHLKSKHSQPRDRDQKNAYVHSTITN